MTTLRQSINGWFSDAHLAVQHPTFRTFEDLGGAVFVTNPSVASNRLEGRGEEALTAPPTFVHFSDVAASVNTPLSGKSGTALRVSREVHAAPSAFEGFAGDGNGQATKASAVDGGSSSGIRQIIHGTITSNSICVPDRFVKHGCVVHGIHAQTGSPGFGGAQQFGGGVAQQQRSGTPGVAGAIPAVAANSIKRKIGRW